MDLRCENGGDWRLSHVSCDINVESAYTVICTCRAIGNNSDTYSQGRSRVAATGVGGDSPLF